MRVEKYVRELIGSYRIVGLVDECDFIEILHPSPLKLEVSYRRKALTTPEELNEHLRTNIHWDDEIEDPEGLFPNIWLAMLDQLPGWQLNEVEITDDEIWLQYYHAESNDLQHVWITGENVPLFKVSIPTQEAVYHISLNESTITIIESTSAYRREICLQRGSGRMNDKTYEKRTTVKISEYIGI